MAACQNPLPLGTALWPDGSLDGSSLVFAALGLRKSARFARMVRQPRFVPMVRQHMQGIGGVPACAGTAERALVQAPLMARSMVRGMVRGRPFLELVRR